MTCTAFVRRARAAFPRRRERRDRDRICADRRRHRRDHCGDRLQHGHHAQDDLVGQGRQRDVTGAAVFPLAMPNIRPLTNVGGTEWTQTPSWSARALRVWSLPPNSPMRAGASSSSIRSRKARSAARHSGRSADCSSSTRPSSGVCASATRESLRCRTGSARPASTATRIIGRAAGPRPMWISPRARSAPGCVRRA